MLHSRQFRGKNPLRPIENFPSLALEKNAINATIIFYPNNAPSISIVVIYRAVTNRTKFQTVSSESCPGPLQEVVVIGSTETANDATISASSLLFGIMAAAGRFVVFVCSEQRKTMQKGFREIYQNWKTVTNNKPSSISGFLKESTASYENVTTNSIYFSALKTTLELKFCLIAPAMLLIEPLFGETGICKPVSQWCTILSIQ